MQKSMQDLSQSARKTQLHEVGMSISPQHARQKQRGKVENTNEDEDEDEANELQSLLDSKALASVSQQREEVKTDDKLAKNEEQGITRVVGAEQSSTKVDPAAKGVELGVSKEEQSVEVKASVTQEQRCLGLRWEPITESEDSTHHSNPACGMCCLLVGLQ